MEEAIKSMEALIGEQDKTIASFIATMSAIDPTTEFNVTTDDLFEAEAPHPTPNPIPLGAYRV